MAFWNKDPSTDLNAAADSGAQGITGGQEAEFIAALQRQAAGDAPVSPAEIMLKQKADQDRAAMFAQAVAARGINPALAMRNAQLAGVKTQQQTNGQAATLRADQQIKAQSMLAQMLQAKRQQDIQNALGYQGIQQQYDAANQKADNSALGSVLGAAGTVALGLFGGGSKLPNSGPATDPSFQRGMNDGWRGGTGNGFGAGDSGNFGSDNPYENMAAEGGMAKDGKIARMAAGGQAQYSQGYDPSTENKIPGLNAPMPVAAPQMMPGAAMVSSPSAATSTAPSPLPQAPAAMTSQQAAASTTAPLAQSMAMQDVMKYAQSPGAQGQLMADGGAVDPTQDPFNPAYYTSGAGVAVSGIKKRATGKGGSAASNPLKSIFGISAEEERENRAADTYANLMKNGVKMNGQALDINSQIALQRSLNPGWDPGAKVGDNTRGLVNYQNQQTQNNANAMNNSLVGQNGYGNSFFSGQPAPADGSKPVYSGAPQLGYDEKLGLQQGAGQAQQLANNANPEAQHVMLARGGPVSKVAQHLVMMAKGGAVPAMVSPGERYLPPRAAKQVAMGKKSPMSAGERIPGKPKVPGATNSYANDTVPKTLHEGGIVIPRSVTQGPNAENNALAFVRAIMAKQGLKAKR